MVQDRELQLPTHRILGRREHSEPYDVERWQVAPSELGGVGGPPRGGYEGTRGEEGQPSVLISMASDGDADSGGDDTVEEGIHLLQERPQSKLMDVPSARPHPRRAQARFSSPKH